MSITSSMIEEISELRARVNYLEGLIDFLYDHVNNIEDLETLYEQQEKQD